MNDKPEPTRPGRRRSEESRVAILTAAFELVGEVGYASLTVEGIARRSGAGKQTVYRWWPSKADVLLEALTLKAELHVPVPDEGDWESDLRAFLRSSFRLGAEERVAAALRALMAEAQMDAAFAARFRSGLIQARREALSTIVDRAAARGQLPPGVSPETAVDVVFGVLWYRLLATDRPLDERLAEELTAVLTRDRRDSS